MAGKPGKTSDILDAVALLVVDMQRAFLDVIDDAPAVVERCGFAIEAARTCGLRVLFTEQVPQKLGPTDPRLLALVPGARVFPKNTFSALQAEGVVEHLRKLGIYHLLVAGIETPVCIYQTALHAHDSDFDVTVLSDCVTGRRAEDGLVTLDALARANCHVLPAETVFYSMIGHAAHPVFAAFNALVKRYAQPGGLDAAPPPPPARESHPPAQRHRDRPPLRDDREAIAEENAPDEVPTENSEDTRDDEPYIGRDDDRAPAATAEDKSHGDEVETDLDDETDDERDHDDEDGGSSDAERGESGASGDAGPRKRRGRRRRGGARRRRARERAAAASGGGTAKSDGGNTAATEPAGETPPPPAAAESEASRD